MSSDASDFRDLTFHGTKSDIHAAMSRGETSRTVNWEWWGKKSEQEAKRVLGETWLKSDWGKTRSLGHLRYSVHGLVMITK